MPPIDWAVAALRLRCLSVTAAVNCCFRTSADRHRSARKLTSGLANRSRKRAALSRLRQVATPQWTARPCTLPERCVLGCTDCHGGNAADRVAGWRCARDRRNTRKRLRKRHPSRDLRPRERAVRQSSSRLYQVVERRARVTSNSSIPAICASRSKPAAVRMSYSEVQRVRTSMMTHGAMLWGAALYNNGAFPLKNPLFGESYAADGTPQRLQTFPPPTPEETRTKGVLPYLEPIRALGDFAARQRVARVRARRRKEAPRSAIPASKKSPGKPDVKLSDRGFGTQLRTDPTVPRSAKNAPARSFAFVSRHQRSTRRLSRQRMQRLPRDLRQRPLAGASGHYAVYGNLGQTRNRRSDHSEE